MAFLLGLLFVQAIFVFIANCTISKPNDWIIDPEEFIWPLDLIDIAQSGLNKSFDELHDKYSALKIYPVYDTKVVILKSKPEVNYVPFEAQELRTFTKSDYDAYRLDSPFFDVKNLSKVLLTVHLVGDGDGKEIPGSLCIYDKNYVAECKVIPMNQIVTVEFSLGTREEFSYEVKRNSSFAYQTLGVTKLYQEIIRIEAKAQMIARSVTYNENDVLSVCTAKDHMCRWNAIYQGNWLVHDGTVNLRGRYSYPRQLEYDFDLFRAYVFETSLFVLAILSLCFRFVFKGNKARIEHAVETSSEKLV